MTNKKYVNISGIQVPEITGAKGGGSSSPDVIANATRSGDLLIMTTALGEGPLYRINPNGPQDIEIGDAAIDDLLLFNDDISSKSNAAVADDNVLVTAYSYGTLNQPYLPNFGSNVVSPQSFSAPVILKKGNQIFDPDNNTVELTLPVS